MKKMDLNCFSGNWPFHKVRYNTVEKIAELHKRCGIEGGIISSCEAIFYQDPYEAELSLSKELTGTGYYHAMTLNPTLPAWKDDLRRCVEALGVKAVRLVPGYHGYTLADDAIREVYDSLRQYNLPLILTLRIEDERTTWMINPRFIPVTEVKSFLETYTDIPTLVANIRLNEIAALTEVFEARSNLFADTSGFMRGLFPVDDAYPLVQERLVFGSNAPLSDMQCFTFLVDKSVLTADQKAAVYSGKDFIKYITG